MAQGMHQFTTGHDGGGGAPDDRQDTVGIGGTATAGDILTITTTANNGAYNEVPAVSDNIGSAGWSILFDELLPTGDGLRVIGWVKIAVGGETTVVATWTGGVNHVTTGCWISDPALPNLVYLGGGPGFNDFGTLRQVNTIPVPENGMTYIGGCAWGNSGVTAAFFFSPTTEGGVGTTTSGNGAGGIQHYNDDGGSIGETLAYAFRPPEVPLIHMFWYATSSEEPGTNLEGVGDLLLGGSGDLTTTGEDLDLAGVGGLLLGGQGELDQEGGDGFLSGTGRLLLGLSGRITAPDPFPPIPPTPGMRGVLGCGIYDVFIFTRGLTEIVGRIPFNQLNWGRVLDDTSAAQVTVDGVSNTGPMQSCCQLLGSIEPYEHEIGIYRNGLRCFSGPVLDVTFPSEQVVIDAEDLSSWLKVRQLHDNHNWVQTDLALMWVDMVLDAMGVENSAGLAPIVQALTGVLGDRLYTPDMGTFAADAISELARTGLDWYCVDRRMVGGPVAEQPASFADATPIPTLTDESFRTAPTVARSGSLMGNAWFSGASGAGPGGNAIFGQYGPAFPATPDHVASPAAPDFAAIEAKYGRIERRVNETKILDQQSADQNAATRYDLCKIAVDVISQGTLLPTAGIDIRQLIPGAIHNVHLTRACVQIGEPYRLKSLAVTAQNDGSEDVTGAWEPVGSLAAHEDLGGS